MPDTAGSVIAIMNNGKYSQVLARQNRVERRALLKAVGASAAVGSSSLGGCLGTVGSGGDCETDHRWCYGVGGELDAVEDGTLFGRTRAEGSQSGEVQRDVVALDADTGERQWAFGPISSEMDGYTDLAVRDGVYFSWCTDDDCKRLYALEPDGEERWTRDIDAGRERPVVADGTVYATSGVPVRALDAATGETRWSREVPLTGRGEFLDDADAVYVESSTAVGALDPDDGQTRWLYDVGDEIVADSRVADGVAYVATTERLAAIADGTEQWRTAYDLGSVDFDTTIVGVASGTLFVVVVGTEGQLRLYALDVASGDVTWTSDVGERRGDWKAMVEVAQDVVYLGVDQLRVLDATKGSERWSKDFDSGRVGSVTVVEDTGAPDHTVLVEFGEGQFAGFTPDGERTWEASVDGDVQDLLVDEHLYVATEEAIYALDRGDGS